MPATIDLNCFRISVSSISAPQARQISRVELRRRLKIFSGNSITEVLVRRRRKFLRTDSALMRVVKSSSPTQYVLTMVRTWEVSMSSELIN